jgi:hypothetical protein
MALEIIRMTGSAPRSLILATLVAAMATFAAGCATTMGECDPSSPDFFKNTSCLASGAYGERQRAMQATLAQEQSRNAAFRAVLAELQAEQARVKGQLSAREADYAGLDAAWRNLKQSLAAETKTNRALEARVAGIDSSVQARKGVDSSADVAARRATRDDLRLKVSMLEQELAAGIYE